VPRAPTAAKSAPIGLVPKQHSRGGKDKLGSTSGMVEAERLGGLEIDRQFVLKPGPRSFS
jgi:hypothetical protein